MTKRDRVLRAIRKEPVDFVPSCFSLHFPKEKNSGEAGVRAHLDFFRDTGADIAKIMNENLVPSPGMGSSFPEAYADVRAFGRDADFIVDQIDFTKRILDGLDDEYFTLGTLHGICASALHPIERSGIDYEKARDLQLLSLREAEGTTLSAFNRIADGLCGLVEGYKEAGVDAIYYAALGGEPRWFSDEEFDKWIKPFDLKIMKAIKEAGMYCFLHICKDGLNMQRYRDYASLSEVVNWGVYEVPFSLEEGRKLFPGCTIMGGLRNRSGVLVDGSAEEIREEVRSVINGFGRTGFILGADCTLATEQDMGRLRAAIEAAQDMKEEI